MHRVFFNVVPMLLFYILRQRGPTMGPLMEFVRPAEQFCTSLVDHKQRQPLFFGEHYDFATKIGISETDYK